MEFQNRLYELRKKAGLSQEGLADLLSVQCYRFDTEAYASTLDGVRASLEGCNVRLNPGIILKAGQRVIDPEVLERELELNRQAGIHGESFFYNEGVFDERIARVIGRSYGRP